MKERIITGILAIFVILAPSACGSSTQETDPGNNQSALNGDSRIPASIYDEITIVVGNFHGRNTSFGKGFDAFKGYVETNSNGVIKVDVFHDGALGTEAEVAQGNKEGSIDMVTTGCSGVGQWVPGTNLLEIWYAFDEIDDVNTMFAFCKEEMDAAFEEHGFKVVGYWTAGPRQWISNVMFTNSDEIRGVKSRSPGAPIHVKMQEALGFNSSSMSMSDVYTSLQTGAVQCAEGTFDLIVNNKWYEQIKYIIEDNHGWMVLQLTFNLATWNTYNEATQQLIYDGVNHAIEVQRLTNEINHNEMRQFLVDQGLEFAQLTDRDAWAGRILPDLLDSFALECGESGEFFKNAIIKAMEASAS